MTSAICNIAKGRWAEWNERVNDDDPTNAVFVVMALQASSEADGTLTDYDTFSALLAGANTEATFDNYARIVLDQTDVSPVSIDDGADTASIDIADFSWSSAGGSTDNTLDKLAFGYDSDSTGGTDANILMFAHYDFDITTNGGDVVGQVNASGLASAA